MSSPEPIDSVKEISEVKKRVPGKNGRDIDTRKLSTKAQRRKRIPGMQKTRDIVLVVKIVG